MRIFFRLVLPMSAAPIATLAMLIFISAWNDYFWPLMVANDRRSRPLTRRARCVQCSPRRPAPTGPV